MIESDVGSLVNLLTARRLKPAAQIHISRNGEFLVPLFYHLTYKKIFVTRPMSMFSVFSTVACWPNFL